MQIKTKIVSYNTADAKPVKQEVNCTVILPPLVFPVVTYEIVVDIDNYIVGDIDIDIVD